MSSAEKESSSVAVLDGGIGRNSSVVTTTPVQPQKQKTKTDAQTVLDALLRKHGTNLPDWADFREIMTEAGLTPSEITQGMISTAKQRLLQPEEKEEKKMSDAPEVPKPKKSEVNNDKLHWLPPEKTDTESCDRHSWSTSCNRYRVTRTIPLVSDDKNQARYVAEFFSTVEQQGGNTHDMWDYIPLDDRSQGNHPKEYKTLAQGMEELEALHCTKFGKEDVVSNLWAMVAAAGEVGLHMLPGYYEKTVKKGEKQKKKDGSDKTTTTEQKTPKEKKEKTQKQPSGTNTDKYGSRLGTQAAIINAELGVEIKTAQQVADKTGLDKTRVATHFKALVEKGKVEFKDGGVVEIVKETTPPVLPS